MNTRQVAAEYRLAYWAKILNEQKASGLGVKAFCELHGINENSYFYWQKKLREVVCQEINLPIALQNTGLSKNKKPSAPKGWVICDTANKTEPETLRIDIGQCKVTVTIDVDDELLSKVCKVLVAI